MASYISNTANRSVVTIMLTNAEAEALLKSAETTQYHPNNNQIRSAQHRAIDALRASINPSARRAGFFD